MFIEPSLSKQHKGWIELICGSMFSGKTEELIRRLKRAQIAKLNVEIFKPQLDVRYSYTDIVSHDENKITSTPITHASNILMLATGIDVVGIDEAQFFDEALLEVCEKLALRGTRVIVAGLDMDYTGKPFGPMPQLMAVAEYVTKVHAICMQCGDIATHSYRKSSASDVVLLGEKDLYEARCRACFYGIAH